MDACWTALAGSVPMTAAGLVWPKRARSMRQGGETRHRTGPGGGGEDGRDAEGNCDQGARQMAVAVTVLATPLGLGQGCQPPEQGERERGDDVPSV